jgi:hypothetical protein
MTAESLTGVWGVARRHRAQRNTGDPGRRGVAPLAPSVGWGRPWESGGSTVPLGPTGQHNPWGGNPPLADWFGGVSTGQGAGDWREPGNSTKAPAAPRGAVHQGQAGKTQGPLARDAALHRRGCLRGTGGVPVAALSSWVACACRGVSPVREPDAGKPHVRFDEQGRETACAVVVSSRRGRQPIRGLHQGRVRL